MRPKVPDSDSEFQPSKALVVGNGLLLSFSKYTFSNETLRA
jgi:hypothetical protein